MKRFLLFILVIIAGKLLLTAQNVDAVDNKLDSISDINLKIDFLNDWTGKNYRKSPTEALFYANKTIDYSIGSQNHSGAGNALIRVGLIHFRKQEYKKSILTFKKALNKFTLSGDSVGINNVYLNRGIVYRNMDKHSLAIEDLFACMRYFEKQNNTRMLSLTYNSIGLIYKDLKKYDEALKYYYKVEKLAEKSNKSSSYHSNTNIANILSIQEKYKQALNYYKKNIEILEKKPNKYKLAQTYHNIGSSCIKLGQYAIAQEYLNQSLQLKESIGNNNLTITTLSSFSHLHYNKKNYKKALKYNKRSLKLAQITNNLELQKNCYLHQFKIFSHLNKVDSSLIYFRRYESLKDSIFNNETLKQIAETREKYEAEKKETQINLLEKENQSRMMQRNSLVVLSVLLLIFVTFITRSFYKNKKNNRLLRIQKNRIEWHKTMLKDKNEALRTSNQTKNKLFQIISHDLRSPLASVSGISKLMRIFIKQEKYDLLEESSDDMEQCINSVLSLTDNLLAWSLNQSGKLPYNPIEIALRQLLMRSIETYSSAARQKQIHLNLVLEEDALVYADRQMLDTIIRNLINNSLKFTPTGGIIIIGSKLKDDHVELFVKDSGIGISDDQISHIFELNDGKSKLGTMGEKGNGLGLILCKQFVEQNNGKIWVESQPNVGTTFRFTIPLVKKKDEKCMLESAKLASN